MRFQQLNKYACGIALLSTAAICSNARAAEIWRSNMDGGLATAIVGGNGVSSGAGTPTATTDRHGVAGGATAFDGTSYFTIPGTGAGGTLGQSLTAGSIALWVRTDNVAPAGSADDQSGPVGLGSSGAGTTQYFGIVNTSGATNVDNNVRGWRVDVDRGATTAGDLGRKGVLSNGTGLDGAGYFASTANGNTPIWQHITATFSVDGMLKMYINGVLQNQQTALPTTAPLQPTNPWVIGSERVIGTTRNFVGAIDDLRIYDHELTPAEISNVAHLIPGDVNNSGVADINDFNVIRDEFGKSAYLRRLGDLNYDRVVDFRDFNLWKNSVSAEVAASANFNPVPEPSTAALCTVAVAVLGTVRARRSASRS